MNDILVFYALILLVFVQLDGLAVVDIGFQGVCTAWRTLRNK